MTGAPVKGAGYHTLIANRTFIVLDIETTTQPGGKDRAQATYPISIGAVVLLNGTRRATFHELTNPGVPVDKASSAHNSITTADLADAADTAAVLAHLDAFLAGYPEAYLVCHNASFDVPHLYEAYQRAGMTAFSRTVIDTEFLPIRLHLPGVPARARLTALASRYQVATTLTDVPARRRHLHKALLDAQNTAEVLGWLLAEAADQAITAFDDFLIIAKPKLSGDIADHAARRRRRFRAPTMPVRHVRAAHSKRGLPQNPTAGQLDAWVERIGQCVLLHCPHVGEKVAIEAHRHAVLLPRLSRLLATATNPGDLATLLVALTPLLSELDRHGARAWWRTHHHTIKTSPPCERLAACPDCVADRPCPRDTIYQLLTRRALDYGLTRTGQPVSLFSRQAKDDLWDLGNDRKMDTWPAQGMHEMAAHMMWMLLEEARRKSNTTRHRDILAKAIARDLHHHDPRLALETARYWAAQPHQQDAISALAQTMRTKTTSDPGYLELSIWYDGPHQRALAARAANGTNKPHRATTGTRQAAAIERRPPHIRHTYRYQLHPKATT